MQCFSNPSLRSLDKDIENFGPIPLVSVGAGFYLGLSGIRAMKFKTFLKYQTDGRFKLVYGTIRSDNPVDSIFKPNSKFVYQSIIAKFGKMDGGSLRWREYEHPKMWATSLTLNIGGQPYKLATDNLKTWHAESHEIHKQFYSEIKPMYQLLDKYKIPWEKCAEMKINEEHISQNATLKAFGEFTNPKTFSAKYLGSEEFVHKKIRTEIYKFRWPRVIVAGFLLYFSMMYIDDEIGNQRRRQQYMNDEIERDRHRRERINSEIEAIRRKTGDLNV
jgi:hypothetical protein